MSYWKDPIKDESKAVRLPINNIIFKIFGQYSNKIENLIIKKTPAVTIVAACINAETGVGPSMASGNQMCKPTWADFPKAPNIKKKEMTFNKLNCEPNMYILFNFIKGIKEKKTGNSKVLSSIETKIIPYSKKISLILLINTAFKADLLAIIRLYQKLIKR